MRMIEASRAWVVASWFAFLPGGDLVGQVADVAAAAGQRQHVGRAWLTVEVEDLDSAVGPDEAVAQQQRERVVQVVGQGGDDGERGQPEQATAGGGFGEVDPQRRGEHDQRVGRVTDPIEEGELAAVVAVHGVDLAVGVPIGARGRLPGGHRVTSTAGQAWNR